MSMSFTNFENTVLPDDWMVSFDKVPQAADKPAVVKRIDKGWDAVKSSLDGLGGIKLVKPNSDSLADTLITSQTHAVMFELVLTKSEFRLDVEIGNVTIKAGKVNVPSDLEDYRNFLASLNGWSNGDHNIVPDADFKKFNANNPKKPSYKDFEEMEKKSKSDVDAFRAWAKTNAKAKKAFEAVDKTAKAKSNDPARVAALKAINESLQDYYKTF
jgi:hypothetical protein